MNHNPHNIQVGDIVILDKRHEVKVIEFTPLKMFVLIESNGNQWQTMTGRLKPKVLTSNTEQKQ